MSLATWPEVACVLLVSWRSPPSRHRTALAKKLAWERPPPALRARRCLAQRPDGGHILGGPGVAGRQVRRCLTHRAGDLFHHLGITRGVSREISASPLPPRASSPRRWLTRGAAGNWFRSSWPTRAQSLEDAPKVDDTLQVIDAGADDVGEDHLRLLVRPGLQFPRDLRADAAYAQAPAGSELARAVAAASTTSTVGMECGKVFGPPSETGSRPPITRPCTWPCWPARCCNWPVPSRPAPIRSDGGRDRLPQPVPTVLVELAARRRSRRLRSRRRLRIHGAARRHASELQSGAHEKTRSDPRRRRQRLHR